MKNNALIPYSISAGEKKVSWAEKDFKYAIKKFRQNAPSAPIPKLYDAYRWLKEQLDTGDEESNKQFTYFIEHFLRILEERGAGDCEFYSEVLRDSAEYKYLSELFHNNKSEDETPLLEIHESTITPAAVTNEISLHKILQKKNIPLLDYDIDAWHKLITEHFKDFKTEDEFVKNCAVVLNKIRNRNEKEPYHVEIVVVYAFDVLIKHNELSTRTKNFAMQLLNLMTDRGDIWSRLHSEYLEIIKK